MTSDAVSNHREPTHTSEPDRTSPVGFIAESYSPPSPVASEKSMGWGQEEQGMVPERLAPAYVPASASVLSSQSEMPVHPFVGSGREGSMADRYSMVGPEVNPEHNVF